MRGVYDRLLAIPEEIDAETTIRELAIEEAALKEEIQRYEAEMREREAQEHISVEGGEEWATLEIPEDATEAVDGWLSELESYETGRAARAEVRKTLEHIRKDGGLDFDRLVHLMGDEAAGKLRKKLGNFYFTSKKALSEGRGLPLDVLARLWWLGKGTLGEMMAPLVFVRDIANLFVSDYRYRATPLDEIDGSIERLARMSRRAMEEDKEMDWTKFARESTNAAGGLLGIPSRQIIATVRGIDNAIDKWDERGPWERLFGTPMDILMGPVREKR